MNTLPNCPKCNGETELDGSGGFDCHFCGHNFKPMNITKHTPEQEATQSKWDGWTWEKYQASIVRLNHYVSKCEEEISQLKADKAELVAFVQQFKKWFDSDNGERLPIDDANNLIAKHTID